MSMDINPLWEMSVLLPAAILCRPDQPSAQGEKPYLRVERSRRILRLSPQGSWSAAMLGRGLAKALEVPDPCPWLELNLIRLHRLDDYLLNTALSLLRCSAARFQRMALGGLPAWAGSFLSHSGAGGLLGGGWSAFFTPNAVAFQRG